MTCGPRFRESGSRDARRRVTRSRSSEPHGRASRRTQTWTRSCGRGTTRPRVRSSSTSSKGRSAARRSWSVASCSSPPSDGRDAANDELTRPQLTRSRPSRRRSLGRRSLRDARRPRLGVLVESGTDERSPRPGRRRACTFSGGATGTAAPRAMGSPPCIWSRSRQTDRLRPRSPSLLSPTEDVALTQAEDQIVVAVIDTGIAMDNERAGRLAQRGRQGQQRRNIDLLDVFATSTALRRCRFSTSQPVTARSPPASSARSTPRRGSSCTAALDTDGLGSEHDVACAMIRAAEDGAHVISLSLGIEAVDGVVPPALQAAVDHIRSLRGPAGDRCLRRQQRQRRSRSIRRPWTGWSPSRALQAVDPVSGPVSRGCGMVLARCLGDLLSRRRRDRLHLRQGPGGSGVR